MSICIRTPQWCKQKNHKRWVYGLYFHNPNYAFNEAIYRCLNVAVWQNSCIWAEIQLICSLMSFIPFYFGVQFPSILSAHAFLCITFIDKIGSVNLLQPETFVGDSQQRDFAWLLPLSGLLWNAGARHLASKRCWLEAADTKCTGTFPLLMEMFSVCLDADSSVSLHLEASW